MLGIVIGVAVGDRDGSRGLRSRAVEHPRVRSPRLGTNQLIVITGSASQCGGRGQRRERRPSPTLTVKDAEKPSGERTIVRGGGRGLSPSIMSRTQVIAAGGNKSATIDGSTASYFATHQIIRVLVRRTRELSSRRIDVRGRPQRRRARRARWPSAICPAMRTPVGQDDAQIAATASSKSPACCQAQRPGTASGQRPGRRDPDSLSPPPLRELTGSTFAESVGTILVQQRLSSEGRHRGGTSDEITLTAAPAPSHRPRRRRRRRLHGAKP